MYPNKKMYGLYTFVYRKTTIYGNFFYVYNLYIFVCTQQLANTVFAFDPNNSVNCKEVVGGG